MVNQNFQLLGFESILIDAFHIYLDDTIFVIVINHVDFGELIYKKYPKINCHNDLPSVPLQNPKASYFLISSSFQRTCLIFGLREGEGEQQAIAS